MAFTAATTGSKHPAAMTGSTQNVHGRGHNRLTPRIWKRLTSGGAHWLAMRSSSLCTKSLHCRSGARAAVTSQLTIHIAADMPARPPGLQSQAACHAGPAAHAPTPMPCPPSHLQRRRQQALDGAADQQLEGRLRDEERALQTWERSGRPVMERELGGKAAARSAAQVVGQREARE